jgi:hypothetical protein
VIFLEIYVVQIINLMIKIMSQQASYCIINTTTYHYLIHNSQQYMTIGLEYK